MMRGSLTTTRFARWLGLAVACLLCVGCGGEDKPKPDAPPPPPRNAAPALPPGEVVVEPTAAPLKIGQTEIDTLELVRQILRENPALAPQGYTIQPDPTFNRPGQIRFVVEPTDPREDAVISQAGDDTFTALSAAFTARVEQAALDKKDQLQQSIEQLKAQVSEYQQRLLGYSRSRVGLDETDASRLERRQLEFTMGQLLKNQIEQQDTADALGRFLERKRYPTLVRIR